MSDKLMYLLFYVFILITAVVATYFKLIPVDYLVGVFGLVIGHGGASLPAIATGTPDTTLVKTTTVASTPSIEPQNNTVAAPAPAPVEPK
jgi:hypothetical protein